MPTTRKLPPGFRGTVPTPAPGSRGPGSTAHRRRTAHPLGPDRRGHPGRSGLLCHPGDPIPAPLPDLFGRALPHHPAGGMGLPSPGTGLPVGLSPAARSRQRPADEHDRRLPCGGQNHRPAAGTGTHPAPDRTPDALLLHQCRACLCGQHSGRRALLSVEGGALPAGSPSGSLRHCGILHLYRQGDLEPAPPAEPLPLGTAFVQSVSGAAQSLIGICAFVVTFSGLRSLLWETGLLPRLVTALERLWPVSGGSAFLHCPAPGSAGSDRWLYCRFGFGR